MRLSTLALLLALVCPGVARAAERAEEPREQHTSAPGQSGSAREGSERAEPEHHFERALEEYRRGHYRAAISALNEAIVLDPESKDLFYNLALVHEKLGQLDRAIVAMGRYIELERDPAEAERAALIITRLRGAQEELAEERAAEERASEPHAAAAQPVVVRMEPQVVERDSSVDVWLVSGTALAATAAVVGIVFGARALALDAEAVDAKDRRRVDRAALVADVSLSVGVLAGAGTALLWFTQDSGARTPVAAPGLSLRGRW